MSVQFKSHFPAEVVTDERAVTNLNRLYEQIASDQAREESFQKAERDADREMLRRPVPMITAYRLMGLLLGLAPPAAIFWKLFHFGLLGPRMGDMESVAAFIFFLAMNGICAGIGYLMAGKICHWLVQPYFTSSVIFEEYKPVQHLSWLEFMFRLPLLAVVWGMITGALGGVLFVGIGAAIGPVFAVPVGVFGLTTFGVLHRWLERDGLIETRQLLPLAFGITATITALILGWPRIVGWN
jgi:hypothetical protein